MVPPDPPCFGRFPISRREWGWWALQDHGQRPPWEYFAKPASYGAWIGVHERFMVYISVEDGSRQDLDAFVNAINYGGLANLK